MPYTLNQQQASVRCPDCVEEYDVVRGSVLSAGSQVGLYLVALHGHASHSYPTAHIAIAVRAEDGSAAAAALIVTAKPDEIGFDFHDWSMSP